jgi:two-component sensor histidine kinase
VRVEFQLPASPAAPQDARSLIRTRLGDRLPSAVLFDLLTVLSELIANAIHYGEDGQVKVRVEVSREGTVRGEVSNPGEGSVRMGPIDARRGTGLGLHIVDAVAEDWRADGEGMTRVLFELRGV